MSNESPHCRDGNKSRARVKQEIVSLRATVAELEDELLRLRRLKPAQGSGTASRAAEGEGVWREIAAYERRLRYAAQVENAKLRQRINRQLGVAKKLDRGLHGRHHLQAVTTLKGWITPQIALLGPSFLDNHVVAQEMQARLSRLPVQFSSAFEDEIFQNRAMNLCDIQARESPSNGLYVVSAERRVWPFQVGAVCDAVLRAYERPTTEEESDFVVQEMASMVEVARFSGVSRAKIMARREISDSEALLVLVGMSDPSDAIGTACGALLLQHTAWIRIRRLDGLNATSYEAYHETVPAAFDVVSDQQRKAKLLTSFAQATIGLHIDEERDTMETWLLTQRPSHIQM